MDAKTIATIKTVAKLIFKILFICVLYAFLWLVFMTIGAACSEGKINDTYAYITLFASLPLAIYLTNKKIIPWFNNKVNASLSELETPKEPQKKKSIFAENYVTQQLRLIDSMDGHDFEYWCADLLRKLGYVDVEVTRGSGDQGVDVLATKDGIRYAIQCKCYSHPLGNTPVQEAFSGKSIYKCHLGVVMTNQTFTAGGKECAEATGVLLWGRDKITEFLKTVERTNARS